jgi:phage-related minor tail protein
VAVGPGVVAVLAGVGAVAQGVVAVASGGAAFAGGGLVVAAQFFHGVVEVVEQGVEGLAVAAGQGGVSRRLDVRP